MDAARSHGFLKDGDSEVDGARGLTQPCGGAEIQIGLLTGGTDRHYAFGLAMALISKGIKLDFIGSDELDSPELRGTPRVNFLNLRGDQRRDASLIRKVSRVLIYYVRLIRYAAIARPKNNRMMSIPVSITSLFSRVSKTIRNR